MELRQLEQFLAVVDHGGLGRAAERLYLSQPTVSGSIKALERELKVELFHRTARRLVPTSASSSWCRWPGGCSTTWSPSRTRCAAPARSAGECSR